MDCRRGQRGEGLTQGELDVWGGPDAGSARPTEGKAHPPAGSSPWREGLRKRPATHSSPPTSTHSRGPGEGCEGPSAERGRCAEGATVVPGPRVTDVPRGSRGPPYQLDSLTPATPALGAGVFREESTALPLWVRRAFTWHMPTRCH